ncbi:lytic murein transglycosylase, partial [Pseudoalteromonas sp. S201]|uniref:lytic murein transglycosylase n=1 Tax=Pseudoalteromonas sp. S201 TaxID=579519 RepID=UPI001485D984
KKLAVILCSVCLSGSVVAKTQAEFQTYLSDLKQEAIAKGYDSKLIDDAFATASYKEKVVSADKKQPEVKESLETYLPKRVPQWKIDRARKLYAE